MTRWRRGEDEIAGLIEQGELEAIAASSDLANQYLDESDGSIESARVIWENDPGSALALAYDAARKAATALLCAQGLRPTTSGGHRAVQDAVNGQFNGPFKNFGRFRRRRHDQQYPKLGSAGVTHDDAEEAITFASDCLEAAETLLGTGEIGPWN